MKLRQRVPNGIVMHWSVTNRGFIDNNLLPIRYEVIVSLNGRGRGTDMASSPIIIEETAISENRDNALQDPANMKKIRKLWFI